MPDNMPIQPAGPQKTITANMKIEVISEKDPAIFAKKCNEFLLTVDNQNRFLNARNVYNRHSEKGEDELVAVIWYLEAVKPEEKDEVKPEVQTEPLGGEKKDETIHTEEAKPEQPGNNPTQ